MTDNNIIKPVKGLQNIGALNPIQERNKRKQNQKQKEQGNEYTDHDEAILSELTNEQKLDDEITEDNKERNFDSAGIDYCA